MNNDMRYGISIDAQQADAELARLHKEATTLAGTEDRLAASTKATTAALAQQGKVTGEVAEKTMTLRDRANKLPDVLGKQAAAISLVSSSLADNNGWVGKAVAGAGQMAAAYGAGGPFALALVGGMALVGAFTSHLEKLNKEQDDAIAALYGPVDAAIEQRKKAERDVAALRRDAAGPETVKEAFARVQGEIDAVEERIKQVVAARNSMRVDNTAEYFEARQRYQDEIKQLTATVELLRQKQNLEQGKAAKAGMGAPAVAAAGPRDGFDDAQNRLDIEEKAINWLAKMREEANRHRVENEKQAAQELADALSEQTRLAKEAADARARIEAEAAAQREALRMAEVGQMQQYASTAIGITSSASTQLIADLVGQQEQALERFGVSVMAQAGQALVSYGAQAIGRGILEASSPVTAPLAAASFAAGGALLAAGIGLGGVAGGLGTLMGGAGGSSAPAERGVPSGFSGGATGAPGGTSITIVYGGASGPTVDHAARAVSDSVTRAHARNLPRDEVR